MAAIGKCAIFLYCLSKLEGVWDQPNILLNKFQSSQADMTCTNIWLKIKLVTKVWEPNQTKKLTNPKMGTCLKHRPHEQKPVVQQAHGSDC